MPEDLKPVHKLMNLDIGDIASRRRNLYEIALDMILMERQIPDHYKNSAIIPITRLKKLTNLKDLSKLKNIFEILLDLILLEHHLEEKYRYCPD